MNVCWPILQALGMGVVIVGIMCGIVWLAVALADKFGGEPFFWYMGIIIFLVLLSAFIVPLFGVC